MRQEIGREDPVREFRLSLFQSAGRLGIRSETGERGVILKTEKEFRERIIRDPGDAVAHYWLGALLSAQGRHEEAEKEYREVIELKKGRALAFKEG